MNQCCPRGQNIDVFHSCWNSKCHHPTCCCYRTWSWNLLLGPSLRRGGKLALPALTRLHTPASTGRQRSTWHHLENIRLTANSIFAGSQLKDSEESTFIPQTVSLPHSPSLQQHQSSRAETRVLWEDAASWHRVIHKHKNEHTAALTQPFTHIFKHTSLHEWEAATSAPVNGNQKTVGVKTMTAAICRYLEHQQETIYQDVPAERPVIPPVRKRAAGTPCKSHAQLSKEKTVDYIHRVSQRENETELQCVETLGQKYMKTAMLRVTRGHVCRSYLHQLCWRRLWFHLCETR